MNERISKVLDEIWRIDLEQQRIEERCGDKYFDFSDRVISVGPDTGKLLYILAKSSRAKTILEVGTSYGYSALWLGAAAFENGGRVHTFDVEPKKIERARGNFRKAGLEKVITLVQGDFCKEISKLSDLEADFVFIDALKEDYPKYFDAVFPHIRKNGLIVADNMNYPPHFKEAGQKYKEHVKGHPVETQSLDIGWGIELTIKR